VPVRDDVAGVRGQRLVVAAAHPRGRPAGGGLRVAPYCAKDGTTLSDHEVAQGYEVVTDPSVYVRFPLAAPVAGVDGAELLIWATTPWTLVSNTAVAVHPQVAYVVARTAEGTFVVSEPRVAAVLGEDAEVLATVTGEDLAGLRYLRPFELVEIPDAHLSVLADYVTTTDGTGLVHQARTRPSRPHSPYGTPWTAASPAPWATARRSPWRVAKA